jgi:hypothetical protein
MRTQVISAGVGVWLMASPALLDYGGVAARHALALGPIIVAASWIATSQATAGVRWINLACAAFLLLLPFGPGYPVQAIVNSGTVGLAVATLAAARVPRRARMGGGWAALWRRGTPARP